MKSKDSGLQWIPLYIDKWLWGSTRIELQPDERSVWIDLLVIGAKDEGYIRANEGCPYPPDQLAGMLRIPLELLQRTLEKCKKVGKITQELDGTYYLQNWEHYRLSRRHQRRFESDER